MNIVDIIFPKKCFGCGAEGTYICPKCLAEVKNTKPICPMCARPGVDGMTHVGCRVPLGLDGLVCLWKYEGAIRKAILSLKYRFASDIAKELAENLADALNSAFNTLPKEATLVPVPIYKDRANWRGFNQAEEMGKVIAEGLELKFVPDLLIKRARTRPQTELARKERLTNLRGVFSLNPNYSLLSNRYPLILFDDIWTTGATLKEVAKVLKRKGAETVWGLTVARG